MRNASLIAALFMGLIIASRSAHAELPLAPKLLVRTSTAMISNTVSGGSTLSIGGLDLSFLWYFSSKLALGLGYRMDFDISEKTIPLKGFDFQGRYYFLGEGTTTRWQDPVLSIKRERRADWAAYAAGAISQRSYFLTSTTSTTAFEGTAGALSAGLGIDWPLAQDVDLNIEVNSGIINFASDPTHVQLRLISFLAGVAFIF